MLDADGDALPVSETAGDDEDGAAAAGDDAGGDEAAGDDAGGAEAGGDDAGGDEAGGDEAGGDDAGGDDAGGEDAGGDDAGGEDAGGDDAGGDEAGADEDGCDEGGCDEAGADDAGGLPGLEDPLDGMDDGVETGVGGIDVLLSPDAAGLRNALGEIGADAEADGEAEGAASGLAGGFDAEAGRVATAPAPACGWRSWPGARFAPISAKAATAEPTTRPPVRTAEAIVREGRCRPGALVLTRGGGTERGGWPEVSASATSLLAADGPRAAAGRPSAKPLMIGSASQPGAGCMAPTSASSSRAVGRSPGCLARHLSTRGRSSAGISARSAGLLTSRYMSAALDPVPNGPCPVAAKVSTAPRLNTSLAGPMSTPRTCSGDMYPGDPIVTPAVPAALASAASEIPKSMTRGPSSASSTLEGFRSRCTTPAAWMALRPSASPAASAIRLLTGSGPWPRTASVSDGPATYAVASHGTGQSRSASTTSAVNRPLTF